MKDKTEMFTEYEAELCKKMTAIFGPPQLLKEVAIGQEQHYVADFPDILRPAVSTAMISVSKTDIVLEAVTYYIRKVIEAEEIDVILENETTMLKYKKNNKFILVEFHADAECWYTAVNMTLLNDAATWSQGIKVPCNILNMAYTFNMISKGKVNKVKPKKTLFGKQKKHK